MQTITYVPDGVYFHPPVVPTVASYLIGIDPPHYQVPALQTDTLYWRMPKLGQTWIDHPLRLSELIAAWHLWRRGHRIVRGQSVI